MNKITVESARQALKDAVALKGADHVYTKDNAGNDSCVYFHDDQPSCIVGHVYAAHGINPYTAQVEEDVYPTSDTHKDFYTDEPSESYDLRCALSNAQACQDFGGTWGEAVAQFEERLGDE